MWFQLLTVFHRPVAPWWASLTAVRSAGKADSLRGRFARGTVWLLIGAIISQGSNLVASIIAARLLGRDLFGKYGIIQSTVGMLGVFAGLGLGITATKYVAELRTRDPERAGRIIAQSLLVSLISGGLIAAALILFAPVLAANTMNAPSLAPELRIAAVLLFINAFNGAQTGTLSGFEAFRTIARINLVRGIVTLPVTVALVHLWRLPGAIWALAVSSAVACLHSQVCLRRHCKAAGIHLQFSWAWYEWSVMWTFSAPVFLSSALAGAVTWAANTMLVNQPSGYAEMGVLSAANQWRAVIGFVPGVLGQFALPVLSSLHGEQDRARYAQGLRWNLLLTAVAGGATALPVILGAHVIMRSYGVGFREGWLVLVLSATTAVISCINSVVGTAILSSGSVWAGFAFNAMWAVVFISGCHILVPNHGSLGLATAMLGAYVGHTIWQGVYLRRRLYRLRRQ